VVSGHDQAAASVYAFRDLAAKSSDAKAFQDAVYEQFDIWQTRGYDGKGKALITGYCSPEIKASMTPTETFKYPLYRRPADLVTDSVTGEPLGRRAADGSIVPWPSRKALLASNELAGTELIWLSSTFDVYVCEVEGGAKLITSDNTVKYVAYAGKTGRPFIGLVTSLAAGGVITKSEQNLPAIRRLYERDSALVQQYMDKNESMVFFGMYEGKSWPIGSLGVPVTDRASVATDKKLFPRGLVMLVNTKAPDHAGHQADFQQFTMDQETGGAVRAAGRADIYMGVGAEAEILAGNQYADGTFYYFVLKPEFIASYPRNAGAAIRTDPELKRSKSPATGGARNPKQSFAPSSSAPDLSAYAYTVQAGDTLESIARAQMGDAQKWQLITAANPELNPKAMKIGQKLQIPASGTTSSKDSSAPAADNVPVTTEQIRAAARAVMKEGRWSEAVNGWATLLQFLPGDEEATRERTRAQSMLKGGTVSGSVYNEREVRRQQATTQFKSDIKRSQSLLAQKDYDQAKFAAVSARTRLDLARNVLNADEFDQMSADAEKLVDQIGQESLTRIR
jgi:membrane-bound lytic murein transglycosylase A